MTTSSFIVVGMSCDHCVRAVTEEIEKLPGVHGVDVDLGTGLVTIESDAPIAEADVRGAVDEAGYEVAP